MTGLESAIINCTNKLTATLDLARQKFNGKNLKYLGRPRSAYLDQIGT